MPATMNFTALGDGTIVAEYGGLVVEVVDIYYYPHENVFTGPEGLPIFDVADIIPMSILRDFKNQQTDRPLPWYNNKHSVIYLLHYPDRYFYGD